ncbi:MAG: GNAT family N-acetyltransferase [Woeseia sp.]
MAWNPEGYGVADYVDLLNRSFNGSWTPRLYHWYMSRPYAGKTPDNGVLMSDGQPVSGAGVVYRQLRDSEGRIIDVGVITGAWTLPEARGHGYFTKVMQESAVHVGAQGCELLLGFVTDDNASGKGMRRAGAYMIPTTYLLSSTTSNPQTKHLEVTPAKVDAGELHALHNRHSAAAGYYYQHTDDWRSQFLERTNAVEVLRVGDETIGIVEQTPGTDRLQWLGGDSRTYAACLASLSARAEARGRRFFGFGCGSWLKDCDNYPELEQRGGFITCLPAGEVSPQNAAMLAGPWEVHSGDRV